jgi:adenine-specific DNA-methyltransferase
MRQDDVVIRSTSDRILEPSCGEAAFLLAAVDWPAALHDHTDPDPTLGTLDGAELHEASAQAARDFLQAAGAKPNITTADAEGVGFEPTMGVTP